MYGEAVEKVPGGKLVRIKVKFDDFIEDVRITGDFFLHPEQCIDEIENSLRNTPVDFQDDVITDKINEILEKEGAELIGIDSKTLSRTLKLAIENGKMATDTS